MSLITGFGIDAIKALRLSRTKVSSGLLMHIMSLINRYHYGEETAFRHFIKRHSRTVIQTREHLVKRQR
jgi:hypothetical protein